MRQLVSISKITTLHLHLSNCPTSNCFPMVSFWHQLLYSQSQSLQRAAAAFLSQLSTSASGASAIEQEGACPRLTELIQSNNEYIGRSHECMFAFACCLPRRYPGRFSSASAIWLNEKSVYPRHLLFFLLTHCIFSFCYSARLTNWHMATSASVTSSGHRIDWAVLSTCAVEVTEISVTVHYVDHCSSWSVPVHWNGTLAVTVLRGPRKRNHLSTSTDIVAGEIS